MSNTLRQKMDLDRAEFLSLTDIPVGRFKTMVRRDQIPFIDAIMPSERLWLEHVRPSSNPDVKPFARNFDFEMRRIDSQDEAENQNGSGQIYTNDRRRRHRYTVNDVIAYIIADNLARDGGISREIAADIAKNAFGYLRTVELDRLGEIWIGAAFFDIDGATDSFRNAFALPWDAVQPFRDKLAREPGHRVYRVVAASLSEALTTLHIRAQDNGIGLPDVIPTFELNETVSDETQ